MSDITITISMRRYHQLVMAEYDYAELEAAGVDNWEGSGEVSVLDGPEATAYVAAKAAQDAITPEGGQ